MLMSSIMLKIGEKTMATEAGALRCGSAAVVLAIFMAVSIQGCGFSATSAQAIVIGICKFL